MSKAKWILSGVAFIVVLAAIVISIGSSAPRSFPIGHSISIPKGTTLGEAADLLAKDGIIRSPFLFKVYTTILDGTTGVKTGEYLFSQAQSSFGIAYRLVNGLQGFPVVKVTIPEGSDYADVAAIVAKAIPSFDEASFLAIAKSEEGYLFPDTYFWPTNVKPAQVAADMKALFDVKVRTVASDIATSSRSASDIIKMASIVEKEATSSADRRIVAGILWKRIDAGMALQVDPPFEYFLHKKSSQLTLDDLKVESPYNLYMNAGLPPTPIDNPGLDAITDTLHPAKTPYWYYLSGKDGVMHYAATLDQHAANKNRYLN